MSLLEIKEFYPGMIAGQPVKTDQAADIINPATGALLTRVAVARRAEVDRAVAAARSAFEGAWARTAPAKREQLLIKVAQLLRERADDLARLETLNVGKAVSSTRAEVDVAITTFEFFAGAATRITGETLSAPGGMLAYTLREALGVCALIVPWNYPIMLTAWKMAPALAAGNTVVVKPASATPLSALALADVCREAGVPDGVVNVLVGPGADVGAYLAGHPGVDKVSFTGSTENGRDIMRLGADTIKRITLELGGKSPNVVFPDADLEAAAAGSVWAIYYSAGQSCEARSRLLVHDSIYDDFVGRFVEKAGKLRVGDPLDPKTQVGSLISRRQVEQVEGYVRSGVRDGAKLLLGGARLTGNGLDAGCFFQPTALGDVDNRSAIAQEEIFGPVVTLTRYQDEEQAVRLANDVPYGLAATIWTSDVARAHRVAGRLRAGTVAINHPFIAFPGIPFGGFKQSGFGREQGMETMRLFTELKSVLLWTRERPVNPWGL